MKFLEINLKLNYATNLLGCELAKGQIDLVVKHDRNYVKTTDQHNNLVKSRMIVMMSCCFSITNMFSTQSWKPDKLLLKKK